MICLRHTEYTGMSGTKALGDCNDGAIMASSTGVLNDYYISMLNITVGKEMNNETVECVHHDTEGGTTTIGQKVLMITDPEGNVAVLRVHSISICCHLYRTVWTT